MSVKNKIAVLGWGSLIPNPGELSIDVNKDWFADGPILPIEYARISGRRLTLVINEDSKPVQTLWAIMNYEDLNQAKENLRIQERMKSTRQIGYVDIASRSNDNFSNKEVLDTIGEWAKSKDLDAVIWTGLKPNFEEKISELFSEPARKLNIENIEWFFDQLTTEELDSAIDYIFETPNSTQTKLRSFIEEILNTKYK